MARLIFAPGIGSYKIEKLKGKIRFKKEIFPAADARKSKRALSHAEMRELPFSFFDFKCYKIHRMIVSVPGRYDGFDILLSGKFNHDLDIVASYKKLGKRNYELVKISELGSTCSTEAEMVVRYFERHYLRKKCRFTIANKDG